MVTHVLLDLDDTLLDFKRGEQIALTQTLRHFEIEPTNEMLFRYHVINAALWQALERGERTRKQILVERFSRLFEEFDFDVDPNEAQTYYAKGLSEQAILLDGAVQLLDILSSRYSLYLVSNGNRTVQTKRIEQAGIGHYFKAVYLSEDVGYNKPAKEFFDFVMKASPEIVKESSVMIGDSLSSDIAGGNGVGITTIWFDKEGIGPSREIRPSYRVRALSEIPALLEQIP